MNNRYSLADHIISFESKDQKINELFGSISIGGEGSYLDSITISTDSNIWETTGYSTGAWVHDKNLSRIGTVNITISQLTDAVARFIQLCKIYYAGGHDEGITLTLVDNTQRIICTCIDCYIQKIPEQGFGPKAANQTWTFTCGKITFN